MKRIHQDSRNVKKINLNTAQLYRQSYFWLFGAKEKDFGEGHAHAQR